MKQIIFPTSATSDVITEADIKRKLNPLIGLLYKSGAKGFLLKSDYGSHTYKAISLDSFEKGNRWSCGNRSDQTLDQWFDYFNKYSEDSSLTPEWFSFETPKELFAWLTK